MIKIEMTITADLGSGKTMHFTGSRHSGGDNPLYYSHEAWERGGVLLQDLIADVERQCGSIPDGYERAPRAFAKPSAPTCPAWQANNFHTWEVGQTIPLPPDKHMCRTTGERVGLMNEVCALTAHEASRPHVFALEGKVTRIGH